MTRFSVQNENKCPDSKHLFQASRTAGWIVYYFSATEQLCFDVLVLFSIASKRFRLVRTYHPENRTKNGIATEKHIYVMMGVSLWSQNSQKRPQNPTLTTVHAKGAECLLPC
jgi:hypothetical protein